LLPLLSVKLDRLGLPEILALVLIGFVAFAHKHSNLEESHFHYYREYRNLKQEVRNLERDILFLRRTVEQLQAQNDDLLNQLGEELAEEEIRDSGNTPENPIYL
jgi:chromosome segregation ATPase